MPNWCMNSLSIEGKIEELKEFYKKGLVAKKESNELTWSFEPYYPYPNGEWDYNWCIGNWGTKWDCQFCSKVINPEEIDEVSMTISFDTAWTPPVQWLEKIISDYPSLDFILEYMETGCCFTGISYSETINGEKVLTDLSEDIIAFVDDDDNPLQYDEEQDCWFNSQGDEIEDYYPINHLAKDYEIMLKAKRRDERIDQILAD